MAENVWTIGEQSVTEPALSSRRRLNRAGWMILLFGVILLASSAAQMAYRLSLPTDGWSWISGAVGSDLEDTITYDANLIGQPSPLQRGDFVLAVEGHAFHALLANGATFQPALIHDWRAGTTARYLVQRGDAAVALDVPLYHWQIQDIARLVFGNVLPLVDLLSGAVGLFVFLKRPYDFAARMLFMLTTIALTIDISNIMYWGLPEIIHPPLLVVASLFSNWMYGGLLAPTVLLLALTFPRPKPFVLRHALRITIAIYGILPLLIILFGPQPFLGWGWAATCGMLSLLSVGHTLVTARDPVIRAQLRWAGLGFAGLALSVLLDATSGFAFYPESVQQLIPLLNPFLQLAFPLALAVAILRYRLFDIDLILSRALVYGTLTLCVIGLYIGIVTYLGALFRSADSLVSSLIATGVVAVAFQPLRVQLQRGVNRLLFGQRNEPYAVIATLGRQIETALAPDAVFSTIVETIGQTLKLPYVAILTPDEAQFQAVFPPSTDRQTQPPAHLLRLPLSYHNQSVGMLLVAPRTGEARFTDVDHKLLDDLARQTGIAVYAAQITADVQRSRERIVFAREEERRRLRRDLHDGLGPQLASQTLTLDVIARLLRTDPDRAAALLLAVRQQVQQAVSDIRELIYGLRPPVLDDLGLHGAIQEFTERLWQQHGSPQFSLDLPELPIALPAAVEVAMYRIIQEAITNVVRHATASECIIHLEIRTADGDVYGASDDTEPDQIILDISDNGIGIAANRLSGVGLQSMRERTAELGGQLAIESAAGGGTRICATLPLARGRHTHEHHTPDR